MRKLRVMAMAAAMGLFTGNAAIAVVDLPTYPVGKYHDVCLLADGAGFLDCHSLMLVSLYVLEKDGLVCSFSKGVQMPVFDRVIDRLKGLPDEKLGEPAFDHVQAVLVADYPCDETS